MLNNIDFMVITSNIVIATTSDEFGFIKFGSRVDLFLPISTEINVKINQKVSGGKSILGRY